MANVTDPVVVHQAPIMEFPAVPITFQVTNQAPAPQTVPQEEDDLGIFIFVYA